MAAESLPKHWDPATEEQRSWYRHGTTGDRGYVVRRDGKAYVKLDRVNQEIIRRLDESWIEEDAARPLTPIHVAQVLFEADRALCHALGLMELARKDWRGMPDHERQQWITAGPKKPMQRVVLYNGLKVLMEKFCGNR